LTKKRPSKRKIADVFFTTIIFANQLKLKLSLGATLFKALSARGKYIAFAVSEAATRNSRSSVAGSKDALFKMRCSIKSSASRIGMANSFARVVGCIPAAALIKSASPRL